MGSGIATTLGVACILAAIVGGGVKLSNVVEIQPIQSLGRHVLLALFGFALVLFGSGAASAISDYFQKTEQMRSESRPDRKPAEETVDSRVRTPETSPQKQTVSKKGDDRKPPASSARPKLDMASKTPLASFTCAINSYGSETAAAWRRDEMNVLRSKGCSFDDDYLAEPDCTPAYHKPTAAEGPWKGFSEANSVLYYSNDNKEIATALAAFLGEGFHAMRGGGKCIASSGQAKLLMIHYRDR